MAASRCQQRTCQPCSASPKAAISSPQLSWSGAPDSTKSYAVTVHDPDAPTMSGSWHRAVANIPGTVTSLPEGAGDGTASVLPDSAIQWPNDARAARFIGAAPRAGHGPHRYVMTVTPLIVDDIGVPPDRTPALLGFTMTAHILARASLIATADTPADPSAGVGQVVTGNRSDETPARG